MAEIFLARELMGGVHNALVMRGLRREAVKGKIGCSFPPSHFMYMPQGTLNFVFSVASYLELYNAIYMYTLNSVISTSIMSFTL